MGIGGRRKLCLVPRHSCCIYRTWGSQEGEWGGFKVLKWGASLKEEVNFSRGLHASRYYETFFSGSRGVFTMQGFHDLFLHCTFRRRVFNVLDQGVFSMKSS